MLVFHTSCGQNKTVSETKDEATSTRSNEKYHTQYAYTDSNGKSLIIQNGFPRGGPFTDPNGTEYFKMIFWTRFINETDHPLEFQIGFPVDSYEVPSMPGKYYRVLVPPDTMTLDKCALVDYGLTDLIPFSDNNIHKPSSLKRTINPKGSTGFYVVILRPRTAPAPGMLRTGLTLKGQDLFYKISRYSSTPARQPPSLIDEKVIQCGRINLKNLRLRK
jgi:hypothetical protein